jgi:hypothetical protein
MPRHELVTFYKATHNAGRYVYWIWRRCGHKSCGTNEIFRKNV